MLDYFKWLCYNYKCSIFVRLRKVKNMTNAEKIKNFWYYHKFQVLGTLVILLFFVMTFSECAMKKDSDLGIAYISDVYKDTEAFRKSVAEVLPDISGDGISNPMVNSVIFKEVPDMDSDIMMGQKAVVLFASGDYQLYIMDKEYFEAEVCNEMFIDLSDMLPEEMKDGAIMRDGEIIAIKTGKSSFLSDRAMTGDNLYIGISGLIEDNKNNEKSIKLLEGAKKFFKENIVK